VPGIAEGVGIRHNKKDDVTGGDEMASLSEVVDRKEFIARAEAYLEQDPARAVDLALERLRMYPDDMDAKIILGIGWYRKGEMEPALEVLRGIAEDVIRWSPVFNILSELSRDSGHDDVADQALRIYMSLNPESPEAIANLEDRLRRQSRSYPEQGNEKPDEEVGLPRAADFKTLTLADLYARQGYRELAEALLKEILASDPENRDALERLQKLRPQVREDARPPVPDESLPADGGRDLFFGEPVAPPFQALFSRATRVDRIEPDGAAQDRAIEPRQQSKALDPRAEVIGELNRWLVSLDRMKGNA
jgi:tetratricopeptide (TPR) repeat protein